MEVVEAAAEATAEVADLFQADQVRYQAYRHVDRFQMAEIAVILAIRAECKIEKVMPAQPGIQKQKV